MSCSTLFSSETVVVVDSGSELLVSPFEQGRVELSAVALSFTPDAEAMVASAGISGTGGFEVCLEDDSASSTGDENRVIALRANDVFAVGGASSRSEVRVTGSSFEGLLWLTIGNFFFLFFRRLLLSR